MKYKKTKKLIETLKPFWRAMRTLNKIYYKELSDIERNITKKTGIPNVEFFWCDNEIVGIGNTDRTLELIHDGDLDE